MDFSEFLKKQEKIFSEFRDISKIETDGFVPQISINRGGYIIALRHSENIIVRIEEFNEKINQITPSIKYDESNIHTTLSTFQVLDEFSPENDILKNLANAVRNILPLVKGIEIEYNEWLLNQDTGIVGGIPNFYFFDNIRRIIESARGIGIQLKFPWGAHITISRFLEKVSHDKTIELLELFKNNKPLGVSTPNYIDIGYFIHNYDSFKLNIFERFKL